MKMESIGIFHLLVCTALPIVFVVVACLLLIYENDRKSKQEAVDLYDRGYSDGYETGKRYAYKQLEDKFTQFEYDNTQLALENDSLKRAYKLWLDKRVSELLSNGR